MANTKVTGDVIANGTISTVHIADDAITAAKLDSTATGITFADLAVSGNSILTGNLTVNGAFTSQGIDDNADATAITINGNEEIGIGTTSPFVKLHVETTASQIARFSYNSTNYQDLTYEGSNIVGGSHVFKIAGSEKMRLDASGNVGIGTTSPSAKLDVQSSGSWGQYGRGSSGDITVENTNTSVTEGGWIGIAGYMGNTANGGYYHMAGITAKKSTTAGDGDYGGDLSFWTTAGSGQTGEANSGMYQRMTINRFGNVGIKTTSPQVPLQIGTHLTTAPADTGLCVSNRKSIRINDSDGSYNFGVYIKQNYSGSSYLILGTRHNGTDTDGLVVKNGQVGIGTDSPSEKLTIDGTASGAYIRISNAASGDISSGYMIYNGSNLDFNVYTNPTFGNTTLLTREALAIRAGGSERMRITSGGDVGINNSSPAYKLDVTGSIALGGSGSGLRFVNGGATVTFIDENWGMQFNGDATHPVKIYNASLEIGYSSGGANRGTNNLLVSGNVGIGTDSPGYTFTVARSITNDWVGLINNTYDGAGNGLLIDAGNGSSGEILRLRDRNGNSKVSFLSNGKVGIGTTSPQANLDVNEDLRVNRYHKNIFKFHTTASASNQYFHIKTGVGTNQVCMHMYHVEGYAYGQNAIVDERFGFHTDSGGSIYGKSYKGSYANNIYKSSDNKVVLVFGPISTYYMSFMVHLIESGMYTELFVKPSAATYSSSNSGAY